MVVKYQGHAREFTIKFPNPDWDAVARISWEQLFGTAAFQGTFLELLPPLTSAASLIPQPSGKAPSAADCWDMRRAEWVDCSGTAVTAMSRIEPVGRGPVM